MYADANGCCQVCGISEELNNKRLAVDHDHKQEKFVVYCVVNVTLLWVN